MLGAQIFYLIIFIPLGLLFIFKSEAIYDISWYKSHGLDEEGKQQFLVVYKFIGVFLIFFAIFLVLINR